MDPRFAVLAGCVTHALTRGNILVSGMFVSELSTRSNVPLVNIEFAFGVQLSAFLLMQSIIYTIRYIVVLCEGCKDPVEDSCMKCLRPRSRIESSMIAQHPVEVITLMFGVILWISGYLASMYYVDDSSAFTWVIALLIGTGGGIIYWTVNVHIPAIFGDKETILCGILSERTIGLGLLHIAPEVYMMIYPVYVKSLNPVGVGNNTITGEIVILYESSVWYESARHLLIAGSIILCLCIIVIASTPLASDDTISHDTFENEVVWWKLILFNLGGGLYQAAYFIPFIQLRPYSDNRVEHGSAGTALILLGAGSVTGRLLVTILMARTPRKLWWQLLVAMSGVMSVMLWIWFVIVSGNIALDSNGNLSWCFFYGAASASVQHIMIIGSTNMQEHDGVISPGSKSSNSYYFGQLQDNRDGERQIGTDDVYSTTNSVIRKKRNRGKKHVPATPILGFRSTDESFDKQDNNKPEREARSAFTVKARTMRIMASLSLFLFGGAFLSALLIRYPFGDSDQSPGAGAFAAAVSTISTLIYGLFAYSTIANSCRLTGPQQ